LDAGKDFWIKQLREERDGFMKQFVEGSHRMGEFETELPQLTTGRPDSGKQPPFDSENASDDARWIA
jgi:hypothetical protein